jgi:hypothetical protein
MFVKIEKMIGKPITRQDISSIAGAPDDASVTFETTQFGGKEAFDVFVHGGTGASTYFAHRIIHLDKRGRPVVHNQMFESETTGTGLGVHVLGRQIENLRRLGFDHIDTNAAKGNGLSGYSIWPKFGYNAKLTRNERAEISAAGLGNPRSIHELYKTEAGKKWWETHGGSTFMRLNLRENSRSQKIFDKYARSKGL